MNSVKAVSGHRQVLWKCLAAASLVWMCFMLWGCLTETGESGGLILRLFPFLKGFAYTDKLVHAGLHAVLASLLWWTALSKLPQQVLRARFTAGLLSFGTLLLIVLFCASFGAVIEGLQWALTTTRSAEWADALAACLAALVWQGLALAFALSRKIATSA